MYKKGESSTCIFFLLLGTVNCPARDLVLLLVGRWLLSAIMGCVRVSALLPVKIISHLRKVDVYLLCFLTQITCNLS